MALVLDSRLYYPLNTSKRGSFRLLTLHPRRRDDEVICTLRHDTWENGTPYEALSYVWGDPTLRRRTITLNGRPFSITESLYTALRDLRIWNEPRVLWVDAICINQDDDIERAEQVRYMGEIYEKAERVIVWLGEADQDSDDAIFFAHSLVSNSGLDLETFTRVLAMDEYSEALELLDTLLFDEYFQKPYLHLWATVITVARRPWWTRAWVVQEFVKGRDVQIWIGRKKMKWEILGVLVAILMIRWSVGLTSVETESDNLAVRTVGRLLQCRSSMAINPHQILIDQLYKQCANPLDKVYSVLSLMKPEISNNIIPNYSHSMRFVYSTFVTEYIRATGDLDILEIAQWSSPSSPLPSWCPDLSREPKCASVCLYLDCEPAKAAVSSDNTVMTLGGCVLVDSVENDRLQATDDEFAWGGKHDEEVCNWDPHTMCQQLLQKDCFVRAFNDEELLHAIFLTLISGLLLPGGIWLDLSPDKNTDLLWPKQRREYFYGVQRVIWGRTIISTHSGLLGLAVAGTLSGDGIYTTAGCRFAVILREQPDGSFLWIGAVWIYQLKERLEKMRADGTYQEVEITVR